MAQNSKKSQYTSNDKVLKRINSDARSRANEKGKKEQEAINNNSIQKQL